jgi:hypothetical protein
VTIDVDRLTEAELIDLNVDSHSWRVRDITAYLENGGLLEHAQAIAGHVSARRMKLYDRRNEQVSLDEVERISL